MKNGCPPRVRRIGIVDDDADARETWVRLLEMHYPKLTVRGFETLFQAYEGITTYDYLLVDISALAPNFGDFSRAWVPLAKYAQEHPATHFVIVSAVSRNAVEDLLEDCEKCGGVARDRFTYGGFMWDASSGFMWDASSEPVDVKRTLQKLISKEDMEWTPVKRKAKAV